jgi:hypothetical protein
MLNRYINNNQIMEGGKLCENINNPDDIYTLGNEIHKYIYLDQENENILIKKYVLKSEYELSKQIYIVAINNNNQHFTPNIYGFFECNEIIKIPKLTNEQQRNKVWNLHNPNEPQRDLGEIQYIDKNKKVNYLVMERFIGTTLQYILFFENEEPRFSFQETMQIVGKYIDKIYEYYNILCDRGYKLNDLFSRNIIITNNDDVMFIDFGPDLVEVYVNNKLKTYEEYYKENEYSPIQTIPIEYRLTSEMLLQQLIPQYNKKGGIYKCVTKSKNTKSKNTKSKNTKSKNTKSKRTKIYKKDTNFTK